MACTEELSLLSQYNVMCLLIVGGNSVWKIVKKDIHGMFGTSGHIYANIHISQQLEM
jgi:hypothetical protein